MICKCIINFETDTLITQADIDPGYACIVDPNCPSVYSECPHFTCFPLKTKEKKNSLGYAHEVLKKGNIVTDSCSS